MAHICQVRVSFHALCGFNLVYCTWIVNGVADMAWALTWTYLEILVVNGIGIGEFKHLPPVSWTPKVELFLIVMGLYPALSVADFVPGVVG